MISPIVAIIQRRHPFSVSAKRLVPTRRCQGPRSVDSALPSAPCSLKRLPKVTKQPTPHWPDLDGYKTLSIYPCIYIHIHIHIHIHILIHIYIQIHIHLQIHIHIHIYISTYILWKQVTRICLYLPNDVTPRTAVPRVNLEANSHSTVHNAHT